MEENLKKLLKSKFEEEEKKYEKNKIEATKEELRKKYLSYREKIERDELELGDYTNLKEDVESYFCDFLERETVFFGVSRPGNAKHFMIKKNASKDATKQGTYYISKKLTGGKEDSETASEDEAKKWFGDLRILLKKIVEATSIDDYAKILDEDPTYKNYSAKQVLMKMIYLESLLDDKEDIYCRIPQIYKDEAVNVLYDAFIDEPKETNLFIKRVALLEESYKIIEKKYSFFNTHILSKILYPIYDTASLVSREQPNTILYGAPGTGKTYLTKESVRILTRGEEDRYVLIQCHPGFDYDDFIEGIKPVGQTKDGQLRFEVVNGIFKDFCIKAKNNPDKDYYFIADEINRANLSSLFGECLSLIEKDYRDDPNEKDTARKENMLRTPLSTVLEKIISEKQQQEKEEYIKEHVYAYIDNKVYFGIPNNVLFIGMMNDVDKSIDTFDLALRRRFKWIRRDCDYDVIERELNKKEIDYDGVDYIEKCKALNRFVSSELNFGKSYEFGHSYFLKISSIVGSVGRVEKRHMKKLFDEYLNPVLREYIRSFKEEEEIDNNIKIARDKFTGTNTVSGENDGNEEEN